MAEISMEAGSYNVNDMFRNGPANILDNVVSSHPLESTEKNYHLKQERRELSSARNIHGLHMTMKLQMEKAITSKIRRLPGLESSNLALRTLLGTNNDIGPEDIFNDIPDKFHHASMEL